MSSSLGQLPMGDGGAPSGGSERLPPVLLTIVERLERLEQKYSVAQEPPSTPVPSAPASAAAAAVPMSQYLAGQSQRPHVQDEVTNADDDDDGGGQADAPQPAEQGEAAPRAHPLYQRLAPDVIADVGQAGFAEWLRTQAPQASWNNSRNLKECEVLAEALDALLLRDDRELAIEVLVRRFVGVRNSDKSGNWNFASVLSQHMSNRTLLRPHVMSAVLREAKNLSLLESGGYAARGRDTSGAGNRSRGGGRGGGQAGARPVQSSNGGRRSTSNAQSSSAASGQAAPASDQARAGGRDHGQ
jgi:hypothetical protein